MYSKYRKFQKNQNTMRKRTAPRSKSAGIHSLIHSAEKHDQWKGMSADRCELQRVREGWRGYWSSPAARDTSAGDIAQLVERSLCMRKVSSSSLDISTSRRFVFSLLFSFSIFFYFLFSVSIFLIDFFLFSPNPLSFYFFLLSLLLSFFPFHQHQVIRDL